MSPPKKIKSLSAASDLAVSVHPFQVTIVPIHSIRPTSENWQIYTRPEADDQFASLTASVKDAGILEPITVSSDDFILSGHRRHAAAEAAGLANVPIIRVDIRISEMPPQERMQVLVAHNRGSRVKTTTEGIAEAMAAVDPEEAIRLAAERRLEVFTSVKTSHELIEGEGGSRRTDPNLLRHEFLNAVISILIELRDRNMLPISARHIHYKLLAGGVRTSAGKAGHAYGTRPTDCKLLSKLLTDARSRGLIHDSWLSDDTRPTSSFQHSESVGQYVADQVSRLFQNHFSNVHRDQPCHVEIVVEKNTIFPLLNSHVSRALRLPISSARGYLSYPAGCAIRDRFKKSGKGSLYVVYVSDHDPEGMDMPKSLAKYLEEDHGIKAIVIRAAVTDEQIKLHNLRPDAEAKVASSRYDSYVEKYGTNVWELDSMDPEILIDEVKKACLSCLDVESLNQALEREMKDDVKLEKLRASVAAAIPELLYLLDIPPIVC